MDLLEKEWFIEAPWGRLSIVAWGDCWDPPVFLCHGRVDSAAGFRPLLSLLPRNFYYVAMELPGNGKSDRLPKGLMINTYDLVYAMRVVVRHFRWTQFAFIGHSLGAHIGKLYNLAHPGQMTAEVDIDPTTVYDVFDPEDFVTWYKDFFTAYFDSYDKFNAPKETAPKYTVDKAISAVRSARGIPDTSARSTVERLTEPAGEGMVRFNFDQRTKLTTVPPFSAKYKGKLLTSLPTPTLTILTDYSIKLGFYDKTPYAFDETCYPNKNYRVRTVVGNHDVHIMHPERMARYVGALLVGGVAGVDSLDAKL